jgi:hypothetical protein
MYILKINDQVYLSNSEEGFDKLIEYKDGSYILQGFYYGSGTCINSDGLGWFIYINHHSNIIERKVLKLSLYKKENDTEELIEEYQLRYSPEKFEDELSLYELEGATKIQGIFMRSLHRFGTPERIPVEISGIKFTS